MEGRPSRGRGGHWRRGGSAGGNDSGSAGDRRGRGRGGSAGGNDSGSTGDRRGRGRGGHHRGRGKRDHYRGRGRGIPEDGAANFFRRDEEHDKENAEDELPASYSRRKLESNWDRYAESEKEEVNVDVPVQRGTDYHVLLTSAGDSFTQFRFSEEKDWEVDSLGTNQVPALFVDLDVLAQSLQELPLHQRLDLEPSLVQESTPVEVPSVGVLNKVDTVLCGFKTPAPAQDQEPGSDGSRPVKSVPGTSLSSHTSTAVISPVGDGDEELDLLLGLQKPVTDLSLAESNTSNTVEGVSATSEKSASLVEEMEEQVVEADQTKSEEETDWNQQKPEELQQKSEPVKQALTEEDLEDWLDSMIS